MLKVGLFHFHNITIQSAYMYQFLRRRFLKFNLGQINGSASHVDFLIRLKNIIFVEVYPTDIPTKFFFQFRADGNEKFADNNQCKVITMTKKRRVSLQYIMNISQSLELSISLRDRPFTLKGGLWFFVSFGIFFSDNTRVRIFIFFVAESAIFFSPEFNIRLHFLYMTKTLNQNIFFSSTKIRIFFQKKTITPPPIQVKWSFPYGYQVY